jgi:hypothetical protein
MTKKPAPLPEPEAPKPPTLVDLSKRAVGIVLTSEVNSGHMSPTLAKNLLAAMDQVYNVLVANAYEPVVPNPNLEEHP